MLEALNFTTVIRKYEFLLILILNFHGINAGDDCFDGQTHHSSDLLQDDLNICLLYSENNILGCDHIKVYGIRYSLYAIRFGFHHRPDYAPSTLHHLNVVFGGEQIV